MFVQHPHLYVYLHFHVTNLTRLKMTFVGSIKPLELKFYGLHSTVVNNVNSAIIIDFLFVQEVLTEQDMRTLRRQKNDSQQQCRDLLTIFHASRNPEAFVQLYRAIKDVLKLQWLTQQIDEWQAGFADNAELKLKFHGLHQTVVNNVNAADIIYFLFQQGVLAVQDVRTLRKHKKKPQQQCRDLLALIHSSGNPQAFVQLYRSIKDVPGRQWLIELIDECKTGYVESNAILKIKFRQLYPAVVNEVNAANIIQFLFQEGVLGQKDVRALQLRNSDTREQCSHLLQILHASEHPLAFVHLYRAVKDEPHLQQLIEQIDNYSTGKSTFIVCVFIQWTDRIVT